MRSRPDLQEQVDAANKRAEELESTCADLEAYAEAADRKLATALEHIESLINELFLRGIDADSNDEAIAAKAFFDKELTQIAQPKTKTIKDVRGQVGQTFKVDKRCAHPQT